MSARPASPGGTPRDVEREDGARDGGGRSPRAAIERALRRRDPPASPGTGTCEPDRRAAVVLVLRPGGDASGRRPGEAGRSAPVVADGVVGRVLPAGDDPPPAPLFPRPLPPDLRRVEALFIVRAERDGDPWSGQVGLPGGHAEAVDDDLREAGLRELEEEAGLELGPDDVLGRLDELRPRSRRLPSVAVTPFVAWHAGAAVEAGQEVADHFWLPLAALESPDRRAVLAFRRDGARRFFPGVRHGEAVVWGLTFAIVRRFLGLLPREGEPASAGGGPAPA